MPPFSTKRSAPHPATEAAEREHAQQFFGFGRQRSESVDEAAAEVFDFFIGVEAVQFAVEEHAFACAGHVGFGQIGAEVALYVAFRHEGIAVEGVGLAFEFFGKKVGKLLVLQFCHGFGQDFLIGLVAQVGDEAALFGT